MRAARVKGARGRHKEVVLMIPESAGAEFLAGHDRVPEKNLV